VPETYRVAPIFLIRMAGVPFDVLAPLATTKTSAAARDLLVRRKEFASAKENLERLLKRRDHGFSQEIYHALRQAIRRTTPLSVTSASVSPEANAFRAALENLLATEARLLETQNCELDSARLALSEATRDVLPRYLVFGGAGVREALTELMSGRAPAEIVPRRKKERARERHLLLYLQRVAAKNDTLSEFGPSGWGVVDQSVTGVCLSPEPGFSRRETFLERWTAHGAAAALNADPGIREELSPRLHPNGRVERNEFIFAETGEAAPLDPKAIELLGRCDGDTPAWQLGEIDWLEKLATQKMIRWEVEVPALEPHAFEVLIEDIKRWRDNPVRQRWLATLEPIAALPAIFARAENNLARIKIMEEGRRRLLELGSARETSDRFLYSASNPIGEECFRECRFKISEQVLSQLTTDAEPWIDLWRDNYAFVASRVTAGLRNLLERAPTNNGAISLPAFLRHCQAVRMPLTGPAMVGLAHLAFQEVKSAFQKRMQNRPNADEWELTTEDCHFIRRDFQYDRFDEFTYPSADLQLEAKSLEAIGRGEYRWILAELHPPVALLHHGFYWSCPNKRLLAEALVQTTLGHPSFHFGFFAADFTATTSVRMLDAMKGATSFVAAERGNSRWRVIPPAEIEVYINDQNGDVCLRRLETREYLGSFARAWVIPLGFHPFLFSRAPHLPRLRCGRVIVQRRSWTVTLEELGSGDYTGVSRDLVLAVERLRAEKNLPRYVYIRPTELALRRSGAEGRDKDTKPVFVDLESYLFLEIFHRWLSKSTELEVTEMLPGPDDLFWQEPESKVTPGFGGRRSFELRTQIVPRT
jgi:hypothetical protein